MKISDAFFEAAARISTWEEYLHAARFEKTYYDCRACCCDAIRAVYAEKSGKWGGAEAYPAITFFAELFKPEAPPIFWWADPTVSGEDQDARRMALLLASQIAKEQGL